MNPACVIYVTECDDGQFGENCVFTCGTCLNEFPCNKTTGLCDEGCAPGYNGKYCTNSKFEMLLNIFLSIF